MNLLLKRKWFSPMIKIFLFAFFILIVLIVMLLGYRFIVQQQIKQKSAEIIENGGISELKELDVNGDKQYILVEGKDKEKPFCLFLHGGPGSPFPYGVSARTLYPEITENCVAVYYDQRGSGKSFNKKLTNNTLTLSQFTEDANIIVDYIKENYQLEKIFVIGQSFGTIVGTQLVSNYPEKFHAYLGISQVTNISKGHELSYNWLHSEALSNGDKKTLRILDDIGEGPYLAKDEDQFSDLINHYKGMNYFDDTIKKVNLFDLIKGAFTSPDYSLQDLYKAFISGPQFSLIDSQELKKEIILTNFFDSVKSIDIPVYFIQGKYDKQTNYELAKQYFELLDAPNGKEFITLEHSAHYPNTLDAALMNDTFKKMLEPKRPAGTDITPP
ncbi:alpha/beta hydrolase [Lysinibacillus sp. Bpr_S20]|uniref:alpha/beta fold hydrolase n=1 Tax=Lysinibacillus sp. Bpr_S20 TaxID=2933964 RepID=UPI0020138995|nr:alpha/beta hydrolase [Lysinibacillus sp. Bpr_S20]MCL1702746.1 alpha/beta hydrolase [Lysinibacillus sp. Bpr_S20]